MVVTLQLYLLAALTLALLGVEVYSFVDALRRPAAAFTNAGKRTKTFWSAVLGIAALLGFIGLYTPSGAGFLGLAVLFAVIPALIYLSDVRPALGGRRRPRGGNGPSGRGGW